MSDKENLTQIIDLCWDATNESRVGPILKVVNQKIEVNNIAIKTFFTLLSNVLPTNISSHAVIPKEPWQE